MLKYVARIFAYLWPHWRLTLVMVAMIFVTVAAGLLAPWPFAILADQVFNAKPAPGWVPAWLAPLFAPDHRANLAYVAVGAMVLLKLMTNLLSVVNNYVHSKLELQIELGFRSQLFDHAMQLSLAYHDRRRSGMIIYIVNSLGDAVGGMIMSVPALVEAVIMLIAMLIVLLNFHVGLALLSLIIMPIIVISVRYYMTNIQSRLIDVRNMEGEALSIVHEAFSMMRVIVAFCREKLELNRYQSQGKRAIAARIDVTIRQTLFSLVVDMTTTLGKAGVLIFGVVLALRGDLTFGVLYVLSSYVDQVYHPLEEITRTISSLQQNHIGLKMGFDLLDTPPDVQEIAHPLPLPNCQGNVVFEQVDFSYKERTDTLKQISFEAHAGQIVGIVGPTGAGKTTLISLIPRFYEISSGRVLIDGIDVRNLALKELREQVSIVLQEPLLFSTTIKDNIRYGNLNVTDEQIVAAAEAANAHDFIVRLPQGYDTELGERGARLSGGERQRICVARAFLKNAPILILDEPTSSIDSKTESVILDALDRLMIGRTTFMIAHRLSTVRKADKILVLDRGQLVEQGDHDQLLARDGLYRQLHDMQNKRAERKAAIDNVRNTFLAGDAKV